MSFYNKKKQKKFFFALFSHWGANKHHLNKMDAKSKLWDVLFSFLQKMKNSFKFLISLFITSPVIEHTNITKFLRKEKNLYKKNGR